MSLQFNRAWKASAVLLVLIALFVGLTSFAQANTAIDPQPRDEEWWQARHAAMNERVAEGNVDLLFIGDSITQGWEGPGRALWQQYYAPRNAVNLGISGDRTQHVLWRLANGNVEGISPRLAVLMIGTNNHSTNEGEEIGEGIRAVVQSLRTRLPETKVLILAIFPRDPEPSPRREKLATASALAAELADGDMIHYLDIGTFFLTPEGVIEQTIMPDHLHLSIRGYSLWAEAVEPKIAELMGELDAGKAPRGYVSLFNGKDLTGWKGLVADPPARAAMSEEELATAQAKADEEMRAHWRVVEGILHYDGGGNNLVTGRDYEDVDMLVDWKITPEGDSGIYMRGTPQIQIWDPVQWPQGSGGLYNNQKNPSDPLVNADHPVGEWNRFRIRMIDERVTIYLNDVLVVDNTIYENFWERDKPIYPSGAIELQHHGTELWFKNLYVRELPRGEGWRDLFNGKDTSGWELVGGGENTRWWAEDGVLLTEGEGGGWLSTTEEFSDFEMELEFNLPPGGNSGVFVRAPREGSPASQGFEVQILDDFADEYKDLEDWQYCGAVYGAFAPERRWTRPAGEWQKMRIRVEGSHVQVWLNGPKIVDGDMSGVESKLGDHPGLERSKGYIGFQNYGNELAFRNVRIRELAGE